MKNVVMVLIAVCVAGMTLAKDTPVPELMQANTERFKELKKRLGVADSDLSRVDVLELIALSYANMLDQLNGRMVDLERRVVSLESKTTDLRTETDALKNDAKKMLDQIGLMDSDLTKLYEAHNKLNDQVNNELQIDGIAHKLKQLRTDVANDLDSHARGINAARNGVNENASAIRGLYNEIRNLRFR